MGSSPPSILVHEFVTGGGWADPDLPRGLAAEGLAMLRAVLADFQTWGRLPVVTTLDRRLAGARLPARRVIGLGAEEYLHSLGALAAQCEAALIIAPESAGTLARLSGQLEGAGAFLLGSPPEAVTVAADKWECHRRFVEADLPTPESLRTSPADAAGAAEELGFPLVVKPIDGAGCAGVFLASEVSSLRLALERLALPHGDLLLQRYVEGIHASVSLLVAGGDSLALSLNEQWVRVGIPFHYQGGVAAVPHERRDQALDLARRAVALVPGLRGYVGVDLLLTDEGCLLIEINPRLTTSYVGLRRTININLAEAIWRACREGVLPAKIRVTGRSAFRQEELCGN